MKKWAFVSYIVIISILAIGLFYYLPFTNKVNLVGTEVKREIRSGPNGDFLKDIQYVSAKDIATGKTLMYKNEGTPWPLSPYVKFDSRDLTRKVISLEEYKPGAIVLATYFGFHLPILNMYPNITGVKAVGSDYKPNSNFNIVVTVIFLSTVLLSFIWLIRKFRQPENIASSKLT
ncbi:MAG: DUF1523 family protein [Bdellovibrionales bacterium]|nr:DUF1523 family protein [Bdellovibrionales bacterium]